MTTIITVHGTGDTSPSDVGEQWWQVGSEFQTELKKLVDSENGKVEFVPFHWDGANSEMARRRAGRELLKFLRRRFEAGGKPYHLIGHSHGGSVIAEALRHSVYDDRPLKAMKSWTSVATPFLQFNKERYLFSRLNLMGQIFVFFLAAFAAINALTLYDYCDKWFTDKCYVWDGHQLADLIVGEKTLSIPAAMTTLETTQFRTSPEYELAGDYDSRTGTVYQYGDQYFLRMPVEYHPFCAELDVDVSKIVYLRRDGDLYYVEPKPDGFISTWEAQPGDSDRERITKQAFRDRYADEPQIQQLCAPRIGDLFEVLNFFETGYYVDKPGERFYVYYPTFERRILHGVDYNDLINKAIIYVGVFVLFLIIAFLPISLSQQSLRRRYSRRNAQRLTELYGEKWISLWDDNDEAINGIANSLKLEGNIAPRNILVGAVKAVVSIALIAVIVPIIQNRMTPFLREFLGAENAEIGIVSPLLYLAYANISAFVVALGVIYVVFFFAHLFGRNVTGPIVANKVDTFFWQQIQRQSFGNDTVGEKSAALHVKPPEYDRGWSPLPPELSDRLADHTRQYAADTIDRIRRSLGFARNSRQRVEVHEILDQVSWGELIHTSYFDVPEFTQLAARALSETDDFSLSDGFPAEARSKIDAWHAEICPIKPSGETVRASDPRKWRAHGGAFVAESDCLD